jgi:myo-inositol-1(or 4)-monophosphatase
MYNTELIRGILFEAGRIALARFQKVAATVKADLTYMTEADMAVQSYLRGQLEKHYPNDGILAEEGDLRVVPKVGSRTWIVDPIDGTAAFVSGLPLWGVSIALVDSGEAEAGFFFMPVTGDLFHTTPEGQVLRNGRPTRMRTPQGLGRESVLLVTSRFHQRFHIVPEFVGKIRSLGSSVAHLCYVATGSAEAAFLHDVHVWDFAAGLAMLRVNGGILQRLDGLPVRLPDFMSGRTLTPPMLAGSAATVKYVARLITDASSGSGRANQGIDNDQ